MGETGQGVRVGGGQGAGPEGGGVSELHFCSFDSIPFLENSFGGKKFASPQD